MVVIKKLPNARIIRGFKGTIDFYVCRGVPCARSWPSPPKTARNPNVQAQWHSWSYISKAWNFISPEVQEAYRLTAQGTNLTGRDIFTKNFITSLYLEL